MIETTGTMYGAMDGAATPPRDQVERAIRFVANHAEDDYARAMPSEAGRLAASLAALATGEGTSSLADATLEGRFTAAVQLVGASGWILARPYEHGVLATVMGGW